MKKCPYCAEEIQDEAVKCKYCGEFLHKRKKEAWYFKTSWLIISFLSLGPLALPLLWLNPRYRRKTKVIITSIVIVITYYLTILALRAFRSIYSYYQSIFNLF